MNKRTIIIIISVLVLGGIAAVIFTKNPAKAPSVTSDTNSSTSSQNSQESESDINPVATDKVEIKDFAISPAAITVKKGTTVTWTNKDGTRHTISPDKETAEFKASELLGQGETYTVTFNTVGTYTYHCAPHPYMKASVIVTD